MCACVHACVRACVCAQSITQCLYSLCDRLVGFFPQVLQFSHSSPEMFGTGCFFFLFQCGTLLFFSLSLSPCIVQNSAPTTPTLSSNFDVIILITSHLFHLHITVMPTFFQTLFIRFFDFPFDHYQKGSLCGRFMGFSSWYPSFPIHSLRCLEQDAFSSSSNVGHFFSFFFSLCVNPLIFQNSALLPAPSSSVSSNFDVIILITSRLFHLHTTAMPTIFKTLQAFHKQ